MSKPLLELDEALALSLVGGPSVPRLLPLLRRFGGFSRLVSQPLERLLGVPGIGPELANRIKRAGGMDRSRLEHRLLRDGIRAIVYGFPDYPPILLEGVSSPPLVIYAMGDVGTLQRDAVAVVGTRRPTPEGEQFARRMGSDLASLSLVVVSGLAAGIDGAAHRGCLDEGGATVAVLAHGLQTIQPSGHRKLAKSILDTGGALISEYPWGVPARRHTFVPRNRIIAGLSQATVVVEGGVKSGARHSADFAFDYGRVVLAAPGRPSDLMAALPNRLIREKRAELCRDASDVLASLRPDQVDGVRRALETRAQLLALQAERALDALGPDAGQILSVMDGEPVHVDELCGRTGLEAARVIALLLQLEIEGVVEQLPGMRYVPNYRPKQQ
jgi:DNA processing protein